MWEQRHIYKERVLIQAENYSLSSNVMLNIPSGSRIQGQTELLRIRIPLKPLERKSELDDPIERSPLELV